MRHHLIALGGLLCATLLSASCSSERKAPGGESAPTQVPASPAAKGEPASKAPTPDEAPPPTATPGGVLALVPGVYVLAGTDCTAPSNAGFRFYNGRGISGTATHDCRTTVRSRNGDTYRVDQSCIDTPSGDGPRTSEAQMITVHDANTFTLATSDESARFRHCADNEVPDYLRQRAAQ